MSTVATFDKWCAIRHVRPLPCAPVDVANFVFETSSLGIETLWPIIGEISRAHYLKGFSDPTMSQLVTNAINEITQIAPPRSWPKEHKAEFKRLSYPLQKFVQMHEDRREKAIRDAQNSAADARKKLAALQPKEAKDAA